MSLDTLANIKLSEITIVVVAIVLVINIILYNSVRRSVKQNMQDLLQDKRKQVYLDVAEYIFKCHESHSENLADSINALVKEVVLYFSDTAAGIAAKLLQSTFFESSGSEHYRNSYYFVRICFSIALFCQLRLEFVSEKTSPCRIYSLYIYPYASKNSLPENFRKEYNSLIANNGFPPVLKIPFHYEFSTVIGRFLLSPLGTFIRIAIFGILCLYGVSLLFFQDLFPGRAVLPLYGRIMLTPILTGVGSIVLISFEPFSPYISYCPTLNKPLFLSHILLLVLLVLVVAFVILIAKGI